MCVNRPLGTHNSRLIHTYLELDHRARPLAFILKSWAKNYRILNSSGGGFSAYALYLLLIFFLQIRDVLPNLQSSLGPRKELLVLGYNCYYDVPVDWKSSSVKSLGELLLDFFLYYGYFDYETYAISIREGRPVLKSETKLDKKKTVCVEDPFEIGQLSSLLIKNPYSVQISIVRG